MEERSEGKYEKQVIEKEKEERKKQEERKKKEKRYVVSYVV